MIQGFHDRLTEDVYRGRCPKGFPQDLFRRVRAKLGELDAAVQLSDLAMPPGNELHALLRDRAGQHAIAVNKQFRLCFVWTPPGPDRVEFTDYH
jgi:proteic killer suppression protein